MEPSRRSFLTATAGGAVLMPFGQAKTYGFNNPKVTRIIVSGTGAGTGVFVYNGNPGLGNPPIAWMTNGSLVDPYGNVLPAVIGVEGVGSFAAGNTRIYPNGTVAYTGTPAANNMLYSSAPAAFNDPFGNAVLQGDTMYYTSGPTFWAVQSLRNSTLFQSSSAGQNTWVAQGSYGLNQTVTNNFAVFPPSSSGASSAVLDGSGTLTLTNAAGIPAVFNANANGTPTAGTPGGVSGTVPVEQANAGTAATGNVTAFTNITAKYTLDSTLIPNSLYKLRVAFNGVWGLQGMTIGAQIESTSITLGSVSSAFATGAASGDAVNGYIEIQVYIVTAATCRISCDGIIHDNTANASNSSTVTSGISTTVATGVAIAGSNTLAIQIKFAASVAAQTITPEFELFTRTGA